MPGSFGANGNVLMTIVVALLSLLLFLIALPMLLPPFNQVVIMAGSDGGYCQYRSERFTGISRDPTYDPAGVYMVSNSVAYGDGGRCLIAQNTDAVTDLYTPHGHLVYIENAESRNLSPAHNRHLEESVLIPGTDPPQYRPGRNMLWDSESNSCRTRTSSRQGFNMVSSSENDFASDSVLFRVRPHVDPTFCRVDGVAIDGITPLPLDPRPANDFLDVWIPPVISNSEWRESPQILLDNHRLNLTLLQMAPLLAIIGLLLVLLTTSRRGGIWGGD